MSLDLAGGHSARIDFDDLAVELGKTAPIPGDQQRIEGAIAVARDVPNALATVGGLRLLAAAVSPVGWLVAALRRLLGALLIEMDVPISVLNTCSASALVGSARMPALPNRSPGERPSIRRSEMSLSMLISGSHHQGVTTPGHKILHSVSRMRKTA